MSVDGYIARITFDIYIITKTTQRYTLHHSQGWGVSDCCG